MSRINKAGGGGREMPQHFVLCLYLIHIKLNLNQLLLLLANGLAFSAYL